ncbi:hypothetical protein NDA13_005111 [Ustilago tritici]|nr:hypothetical protein NDA13_005111 [Ustilago tritici]
MFDRTPIKTVPVAVLTSNHFFLASDLLSPSAAAFIHDECQIHRVKHGPVVVPTWKRSSGDNLFCFSLTPTNVFKHLGKDLNAKKRPSSKWHQQAAPLPSDFNMRRVAR